MQLLMSPASPFVRKARVLIREANLMDTVTEVEVATTPLTQINLSSLRTPWVRSPHLFVRTAQQSTTAVSSRGSLTITRALTFIRNRASGRS